MGEWASGRVGEWAMSRRDGMKVARQFTAWDAFRKRSRPVGNGVMVSTRAVTAKGSKTFPPTQSYRTLRDGYFPGHIPGS